MTTKPHSLAVSPTSAQVEAHVRKAARSHPGLVAAAKVGKSQQGRPLYAVTVTDGETPDDDKQHVLILAGQHGNEESGRIVALALIDWLTTPAAAATRRRQKIVVMPNVNPDGAELDQGKTPGGVNLNREHGPAGPTTPEARAVEQVAGELGPELFVDLHAKGYSGCAVDMVLYPWVKPYTEDDNLLHEIAADMAAAGEKAGLLQMTHPLTWPGWGGTGPGGADPDSTTSFMYRCFKSLAVLTENSESNQYAFGRSLVARTGLAKLRAALAWGNRRHPKLPWRGYPNMLVSEFFSMGVMAWGATAAERRASRLAVWRNLAHFPAFGLEMPVPPKTRTLHIEYTGQPIAEGIAFQLAAPGRRRVRRVTYDGRPLPRSRTAGWHAFAGPGGTYVLTSIEQFPPGKHELAVDFG